MTAGEDDGQSPQEEIAALRRQLELLRESRSEQGRFVDSDLHLFQIAISETSDGIVVLESGLESVPQITWVNQTFQLLTGLDENSVLGHTLEVINILEQDRPVYDQLVTHILREQEFDGELGARREDGTEYALELSVRPVHDSRGIVTRSIVYLRDVSDRKARLVSLERQAQFDGLTGLPNRLLLFGRVEQALAVQRRARSSVALMIMDLNRFKEVNDILGFQIGDLLLKQVAFRLSQIIGSNDSLARIGGDEFAVLLPQISGVSATMESVKKVATIFDAPFQLGSRNVDVGAAIGVALSPHHAIDASSLVRCADVAMYRAKSSKTEYLLYSPDQEQNTTTRLELGSGLRHAIENGEMVLYYQPKVHLATSVVDRVEALVRWRHPVEGLIAPDRFVPLAENNGLMKPLTAWVLNEAIRQCRAWHDAGMTLNVAVNLSPSSLQDASLPELVSILLDKWNLPPSALKLEITESSLMTDPVQAMAILSLLQTLGVSISIDDFGTGYSSLSNLRQIPFDEVKIDKSFVMEMMSNEGDTTIVRAIIDLAHNLGRQVVAEGVETEQALKKLHEWGCDAAQGYYISRPIPAADVPKWLQESSWKK